MDEVEIKDTANMSEFDKKYNSLTRTLRETIKDYSLVGIRKLDVSDEDTILELLAEADMCLNVHCYCIRCFSKKSYRFSVSR